MADNRQRSGRRRRVARGRQRAAHRIVMASTPATVAAEIRQLIGCQVERVSRKLTDNRFGHSAADILTALGPDAPRLQTYMAEGAIVAQTTVVTGKITQVTRRLRNGFVELPKPETA